MSKPISRLCPGCGETKDFRADQKTCGCIRTQTAGPVENIRMALRLPRTKSVTKAAFLAEVVAEGTAEIDRLKEVAKENSRKSVIIRKPKTFSNLASVFNITDHHFGKLAWGLETGFANYDVKIATEVFWRAFNALLERTLLFGVPEEIWFVVGNDLFNADDTQGRTTAGTQVESDVRYEKTHTTVRSLLIDAIEILRGHTKRVKVIVMPGNHDNHATWCLGDSLECYFHKYSDVEVDNRPCPRKYHAYGIMAAMITHGNKGRRSDYPLVFAAEQPAMWSAAKHREVLTGHLHYDEVTEYHGVKVRIMPALCPPDAWHSENGFVGNLRSSQALIYEREQGLIGTAVYTDDDSKIEHASKNPEVK